MRAISASVIVLAGSILLAVGSLSQLAPLLLIVGGLVGVIGLFAWAKAFQDSSDK